MKKIIVTFLAVILGMISLAAQDTAADNAKLPWITDYQQALKTAKTEHKPILALFTGSDWCGYCIRMDKQFWKQGKYSKAAAKNYVLLYVDFPRRSPISPEQKTANQKLASQFGVSGFPTIVLINPDGKELGRTHFSNSDAFSQFLKKSAQSFQKGK